MREAISYSEEKFGMGDSFVDAIEDALGKITADPQRFKMFGKRCRIFRMNHLPYYLVYLYLADQKTVTIFAVAHTSRAPGYWLSRVPE